MKDKIYFSNLNGLRFIAAFMVIFSHIELSKSYFGLANNFEQIKHLGRLGVSLFFVLSGFLITFLLLKEKEKKGTVGYSNFYMRRILRIWPLYYFIVVLSLFILPLFDISHVKGMILDLGNYQDYVKVIFLFVFFLPNLLIQIKLIPFATQTWSIGTEEQFYLIWPWVINNIRKLKRLFLILIVSYNIILYLIESESLQTLPYFSVIKGFIHLFQLDALTIGALGAYILYNNDPVLKLLTSTFIFIIVLISMLFLIAFNLTIPIGNSVLYSLHFGIIILCLVHNPIFKNVLENTIINYLGKISYGLYMYHQMLIVFTINVLLKKNTVDNFLIYILSIILTILISAVSYHCLEAPFLNKKKTLSIFNNEK